VKRVAAALLPLPGCGEPCGLPPCDYPLPVVSFH